MLLDHAVAEIVQHQRLVGLELQRLAEVGLGGRPVAGALVGDAAGVVEHPVRRLRRRRSARWPARRPATASGIALGHPQRVAERALDLDPVAVRSRRARSAWRCRPRRRRRRAGCWRGGSAAVTYQGEVSGTPASACGGERVLLLAPRGSSAASSCASIRSGRMCAARRACTSATRCDSSVLSASASVRNASAAPSRARVTWSKGTSSPAASRSRSVEQRRVGHAAGQRVVDQRDRVGLAADLREDLGVGDDRRAVEVQRARPRRRRGSPRPRRSRRRRRAPAPCGTGRRRPARRCRSSRRTSPRRRGSPRGRPRSSRRAARRAAG